MKKQFLPFPPRGESRQYAAKITSRRMGFQGFHTHAHRSDAKEDKRIRLKTDGLEGDMLDFVKELNRKFADLPEVLEKEDVEDIIKNTLKGLFGDDGKIKLVDDVNELKNMLDGDGETSIKTILTKQGNHIQDLLSKVKATGGSWAESLEQFKEELESAEDELKAIRRNQSGMKAFVIKAPAVTTTSSSMTNSISDASAARIGDGPIYTMQRGTPFVLQFVNVGSTTAAALIWFDEVQREGDFAITAEGTIKPLVQYKFERKSADYKKAAGRTTITEEFTMDYPRVVSTIRRLMEIDCRNDMNGIILADMVTAASPYAYNGLDDAIVDPDDFAAIGAAIAQLQSLYYTPNVLVMNPADSWRIRLTKGTDGHYVSAPFEWNGTTYEFGRVIVDPEIAVGHFFIGDGQVYNVDMRGDIIVRIGYASSTDDFEKNQYTIIVEQYFYNYISTARRAGLIYASFDTIKQDIVAA